MLKFKIILNKEPVIKCTGSDPNNGFKNFPINKSKQQDNVDCKEDKTSNPKILFCGRFMFALNFILIS